MLPENLKPNEAQALVNFRKGLRLDHRRKLKNLPEHTTLPALLEQVMDFEEGDELEKDEKRTSDKKRKASHPDKDNDKDQDRSVKKQRYGQRKGRLEKSGSNSNKDPVANKSSNTTLSAAYDWFNKQPAKTQENLRARKACFGCGNSGHMLGACPKNPDRVSSDSKN